MKKKDNQKNIWDSIANEWNEFRVKNSAKQGRHVKNFLEGKTGKILDLGSGSGKHLTKINNGKMYLLDFSREMINLARKNALAEEIDAEFYVSSMEDLPFQDNFFDYAIVESSLHCLPKEKHKQAVQELFRVLKPKGRAEISVWNKNSKRFKNSSKEKYVAWRDKGKRYYYLFEPEEIYLLFKKEGFKIVKKEEPQRMIIFIVEK